ncbi:MAG: hypothetical protein R2690_05795 [Acidimicrobiales bacterium]
MAETVAPAARRTVVLGASVHGVHAAEVLRAAGGTPVGYVDDAVPAGTVLHGLPVLGTLADLGAVLGDGRADDVLVGIGDNAARCRLVAQLRQEVPGVRFATAVHPSAVIGARTTIGDGTVVMAGVVVNNDCRIGEQVILYTSCSVDHDNVVGDYASLAPNAATGGNVTLGERRRRAGCVGHPPALPRRRCGGGRRVGRARARPAEPARGGQPRPRGAPAGRRRALPGLARSARLGLTTRRRVRAGRSRQQCTETAGSKCERPCRRRPRASAGAGDDRTEEPGPLRPLWHHQPR